MKKYITAFAMTQSMFCSVPFQIHSWDEKSRPYMLLFLPVIGLEIGAIWAVCNFILREINIPFLVYALIMCVVPFITTGFIHLDGFMDVTDAIGSYRDLEKRREILKDSHVGSFAVVWCVILFIALFAFFGSAPSDANGTVLLFIPVLSRAASAMAVTNLKPMSTSQYAQSRTTPKWHNIIFIGYAVIALAVTSFTAPKYVLCLVIQLLAYCCCLHKCYKSLQGMNGDISGYCITVSEAAAVAVWAIL